MKHFSFKKDILFSGIYEICNDLSLFFMERYCTVLNNYIEIINPCVLIDRELIKFKRDITNVFKSQEENEFIKLNSSSMVTDFFTMDQALSYFARITPEYFGSYFNVPSSSVRKEFMKFNFVFPNLKMFDTDLIDPSFYSYFYKCFLLIDELYSTFEVEESKCHGVSLKIKEDTACLYVHEKLDGTRNVSMFGGSLLNRFKITVFWCFDSDQESIYSSVLPDLLSEKLDCATRFYDEFLDESTNKVKYRDVVYDDLNDYLDHFNQFGRMPRSFYRFMWDYKRAAFAEFATPFLSLMVEYLQTRNYNDTCDHSDDSFLTMHPIERFLFLLKS